jgi:tRNA-2-methylthio-N6-dimethylallyladenosine synthase
MMSAPIKKVFVETHGCQMNVYDSSKMVDVLKASYAIAQTNNPLEADILLLNTCSIREKSQEKVFSDLGRWYKLKKQRPGLIIGVGGCVASQEGQEILKRAPYVDVIFGPQTLHRLPAMLDQAQAEQRSVVDVSFPEIEKFDALPAPRADGPTAFVSIMEGCSKYCSFCIVPYTRGEEISRPFDDVLAEVAQLAEQGVREVTLLGQNVNDYQGTMHGGGTADLALLIHYLASLDNIHRLRFTTSHPKAFTDNLIMAYKNEPKLANHLHLPVQSGSNRILGSMKRGYHVEEFKDKIAHLRQYRPNISITSDFIIGFPGETDADFKATLDLVDDIGFDGSFSFIYSPRPGTPAAKLVDNVPLEEKKQRLALLQKRLVDQYAAISESMNGTVQTLLVTGMAKKYPGEISGRTENNRVVNFQGSPDLIGQLVKVRITEVCPNSLRANLIYEYKS